jgi:predicted RNA-binding Zn ribbon-like protein
MTASTWDWLDGSPALDLANTVKRVGWQERELLRTPADLDSWLEAAALPAPRPASVDEAGLRAVLALRDPALRLLHARSGRGDWLRADVEAVNAHLLAAPELVLLGEHPGETARHPLGTHPAMTRLLAGLAADVRDATQRTDLAFCDAPGCGQMFYRRRTNQAWCGAPCGNRARVARHQAG